MTERENSYAPNKEPFSFRKVMAGFLVAATLSGAGSAIAEAEENADIPKSKVGVETQGELPSQENVDAISGAAQAVTDAEKAALRRAILKATPTPTPTTEPLPTDRITEVLAQYKEQRVAKYVQEIKDYGCTETNPEVLDLYANLVNIVDSKDYYVKGKNNVYPAMLGSITREQLLDYFVTKEGLDFYREDGVDKFLILNGDKKLNSALTKTIKWYKENGVNDITGYLRSNGVYAFSFYYFSDTYGIGAATLYKEGVIVPNIDSSHAKKFKESNLMKNFRRNIIVESMGIAELNFIFGMNLENQIGNEVVEVVKSLLAARNYDFLYKKTGNKDYKNLTDSMNGSASDFYDMYGVSTSDPQVVSQSTVLMISNLVKAAGSDDWSFYNSIA